MGEQQARLEAKVIRIPDQQRDILQAVASGDMRVAKIVDAVGKRRLTDRERQTLREALADELVASGLDDTDEPTAYGLVIEQLIDRVGKL